MFEESKTISQTQKMGKDLIEIYFEDFQNGSKLMKFPLQNL